MKYYKLIFSIFLLLAACMAPGVTWADPFSHTLEVFKKSDAVKPFLKNNYGYAIFPMVGKGAFIVGGSYGEGRVYRQGQVTGLAKLMEGSIGFQFGGQALAQIIFFQDKRAYDEFTSGGFEFDGSVSAVVITAGAQAKVGTDGGTAGASAGPATGVQADIPYYKGMAVFVHAKGGLMIEASVGGQKFTFTPL